MNHSTGPLFSSSSAFIVSFPRILRRPHPAATPASHHIQSVHTQFAGLFFGMWDFPASPCPSPCYQPCLFLVFLLCLPLVKDLSFLFLTKASALIPFARSDWSPGFCPCLSPALTQVFSELIVCQESGKLLNYLHPRREFCAAIGFTHHPFQ